MTASLRLANPAAHRVAVEHGIEGAYFTRTNGVPRGRRAHDAACRTLADALRRVCLSRGGHGPGGARDSARVRRRPLATPHRPHAQHRVRDRAAERGHVRAAGGRARRASRARARRARGRSEPESGRSGRVRSLLRRLTIELPARGDGSVSAPAPSSCSHSIGPAPTASWCSAGITAATCG